MIATSLMIMVGLLAHLEAMRAWIVSSAPANLKATYLAVMASFSNLAFAASQLCTKYLNQVFTVTRGGYGDVGDLLIAAAAIGLALPVAAVAGVRLLRLRTA